MTQPYRFEGVDTERSGEKVGSSDSLDSSTMLTY